ncbi:MAG TPA: hypothetical protein VF682_06805 [Pseudomonas sp.]
MFSTILFLLRHDSAQADGKPGTAAVSEQLIYRSLKTIRSAIECLDTLCASSLNRLLRKIERRLRNNHYDAHQKKPQNLNALENFFSL